MSDYIEIDIDGIATPVTPEAAAAFEAGDESVAEVIRTDRILTEDPPRLDLSIENEEIRKASE